LNGNLRVDSFYYYQNIQAYVYHQSVNQQENLMDKIVVSVDSQNNNQKQESENMEVHHHPNLHHKPKPIKEYLLEGLMIFIAVTLGFFAESFRENLSNHEKEKRYISGIVRNLKDDTAQISFILKRQSKLLTKIDSALLIPTNEIHDFNKQDTFYHHFMYFFVWVSTFEQNDNTLIQLRNAGGFNIIHNKSVVDSITELGNLYSDGVKLDEQIYLEDWKEVSKLAPKLIRINYYPATQNDSVYFRMPHQTEFFTQYNKPLLEELYSWIRIEGGQLKTYKLDIDLYKLTAIRLIQFLQKEYDLENEK